MILKIERQEQIDNGKEGSIRLITEIYQGNNYKFDGTSATIGNDNVLLTSYDLQSEITGNFIHYETLNAYLMNNEGKTIERII